jgi:midasin
VYPYTLDEARLLSVCPYDQVARRIPEPELAPFATLLANFWEFYRGAAGRGAARAALGVRDLVAWAQFICAAAAGEQGARRLAPAEAYAHGAYLTLLDG